MIGAITAGLFSSGVAAATNSYESIQTYSVGAGGSSSITFSSIPSTYKHLQIRAISRTNEASTGQSAFWLQCNSDTAANYSWHRVYGNGATATAGAGTSTTWALVGIGSYANNPANEFGATIVDILDYAATNKYKTFSGLTGEDENGAGYVGLHSGSWRSTNAVTSLTISPAATTSFVQYSSFALYGIRG